MDLEIHFISHVNYSCFSHLMYDARIRTHDTSDATFLVNTSYKGPNLNLHPKRFEVSAVDPVNCSSQMHQLMCHSAQSRRAKVVTLKGAKSHLETLFAFCFWAI